MPLAAFRITQRLGTSLNYIVIKYSYLIYLRSWYIKFLFWFMLISSKIANNNFNEVKKPRLVKCRIYKIKGRQNIFPIQKWGLLIHPRVQYGSTLENMCLICAALWVYPRSGLTKSKTATYSLFFCVDWIERFILRRHAIHIYWKHFLEAVIIDGLFGNIWENFKKAEGNNKSVFLPERSYTNT